MRRLVAALALVAAVACDKSSAAPTPAPRPVAVADADAAPVAAEPPATAGAPGAPATQAACEAAVAHMKTLAPAKVPGDAEDLADCLRLTADQVRCLTGAADLDAADACLAKSR